MSVTKQELLPLKEDNLKLKENFKEFWKKHESNKKYIFKEKVKEFMEQQEILIENLYHKIENLIDKDNDRYNNKTGIVAPVPQKRRSEISYTRKCLFPGQFLHSESLPALPRDYTAGPAELGWPGWPRPPQNFGVPLLRPTPAATPIF